MKSWVQVDPLMHLSVDTCFKTKARFNNYTNIHNSSHPRGNFVFEHASRLIAPSNSQEACAKSGQVYTGLNLLSIVLFPYCVRNTCILIQEYPPFHHSSRGYIRRKQTFNPCLHKRYTGLRIEKRQDLYRFFSLMIIMISYKSCIQVSFSYRKILWNTRSNHTQMYFFVYLWSRNKRVFLGMYILLLFYAFCFLDSNLSDASVCAF